MMLPDGCGFAAHPILCCATADLDVGDLSFLCELLLDSPLILPEKGLFFQQIPGTILTDLIAFTHSGT
ncbi:MAG: hypothetical protein KDE31_25165, partial [Caldilineaceae bacterium]|nr:hypothetical protein [Caldilineaceae bacterium]